MWVGAQKVLGHCTSGVEGTGMGMPAEEWVSERIGGGSVGDQIS